MKDHDTNFIHSHLLEIVRRDPSDFEPFGETDKSEWRDCSSGCCFYLPLGGEIGMDWGVCANEKSERSGLLTFEHQGCKHFDEKSTIGKQGH